MAVTLAEALLLMNEMGIETVKINDLIRVFLQTTPQEETTEQEEVQELPEIPTEKEGTKIYNTYFEAKKAAQKGQKAIKDVALGGWIVI